MRWLMCLRASNLVAIAALMRLSQREFSPSCSISPLDICLYFRSVLYNCFGGDSPDAENATMPLLAFNTAQYYTPVCLLPSMFP
jgi:hypothetical protein